ncbi:pyridoxal phosphate-dependent transferase, partial [Tanacetum coccineum]
DEGRLQSGMAAVNRRANLAPSSSLRLLICNRHIRVAPPGYWYNHGDTMSIELEKHIRQLHSVVGNAVTEARYVVFGIGAMQLISAAIFALASENVSSPSNMFEHQTMFFNGKTFNFEGDTKTWQSRNDTDGKDVIEFVISPNNPKYLGSIALVEGKSFTSVDKKVHTSIRPFYSSYDIAEEVMIFSMSKFTGHAVHADNEDGTPTVGASLPPTSLPCTLTDALHTMPDKKEDYEGVESRQIHLEEEDKEQCSPVSVLDPLFEDDEEEHDVRAVMEDGYDLKCCYTNVQRLPDPFHYSIFNKLLSKILKSKDLDALKPRSHLLDLALKPFGQPFVSHIVYQNVLATAINTDQAATTCGEMSQRTPTTALVGPDIIIIFPHSRQTNRHLNDPAVKHPRIHGEGHISFSVFSRWRRFP